MSKFRRGAQPTVGPFEAGQLPEPEKHRLARSLLAEFGAERVSETSTSELIHSCVLPFGLHRNGDRHPSARLNWSKLTYLCEVCGGGGLLWFIATCRETDSDEARSWLASETGLGGIQELNSLLTYLETVFAGDHHAPTVIPRMDPRVIEPWKLIHPYLTEVRGIPETNIMALNVGWDPRRDRIVIPHFWRGDLVGWQTRRLADDGTPKYLSSPEFPKDETLYNYVPSRSVAVVVESPMSVLAKHHAVPNMEATFGSKVTDRQVRLLAEHERVILWMDNDPAGWHATQSVAERLEGYSQVWVVDSDWDADAADLGDEEVASLVERPLPYAVWSPPGILRDPERVESA